MVTFTLAPLMIPSVWPFELVFESTLIAYGRFSTVVCTTPSGPEQWLNASFAAVPTLTGEVPVWLPVGTLPEVVDAGVEPTVVQVTLTGPSFRMVFDDVAVYEPP